MVRGFVIFSALVIACGGSTKRPPLEEVPIDTAPTATQEPLPAISATVTPTATASVAPTSKNGSTKHPKKR